MSSEGIFRIGAIVTVSGAMLFAGCGLGGAKAQAAEDAAKSKVVAVQVTPAARRVFEDRIAGQGNLNAKKFAMVAPLIDGTITDFYVDEGDAVKAGKTKLFQIDKVKVERAAEIAEQDLAMAQAGMRDAEAQLAAAQAQYDKVKLDFDRYSRLFEQKAITPDAMEQADAGFKVASAGLERANAGMAVAGERLKQAESALIISKKTLADSLIFSPIDGIVSLRMKEPGEFGPAGTPVLRVVDPSLLELSAFVSGEYYPRVALETTEVRVVANGVDAGGFPISYKSPEIQPDLRNFEIKCLIANPPGGVVPGALANFSAVLTRKEALGVPEKAIQRRAGKEMVFTVENGQAKAIEITRGIETDGWTEVASGEIADGMPIVTMGQFLADDGVAVTVLKEGV